MPICIGGNIDIGSNCSIELMANDLLASPDPAAFYNVTVNGQNMGTFPITLDASFIGNNSYQVEESGMVCNGNFDLTDNGGNCGGGGGGGGGGGCIPPDFTTSPTEAIICGVQSYDLSSQITVGGSSTLNGVTYYDGSP